MKARWHILQDGDTVTLCRQRPPRFDFAVHTVLPRGRPTWLAHQIRQDLWRALQNVRGFSPVVRLQAVPAGWAVTAGGRAAGQIAPQILERVTAVLEHAGNRARWMRHATGEQS